MWLLNKEWVGKITSIYGESFEDYKFCWMNSTEFDSEVNLMFKLYQEKNSVNSRFYQKWLKYSIKDTDYVFNIIISGDYSEFEGFRVIFYKLRKAYVKTQDKPVYHHDEVRLLTLLEDENLDPYIKEQLIFRMDLLSNYLGWFRREAS